MKFQISKAERCAWRGRYVNINDRQVARVTLDPTADRGPRLSFAFGVANFANVWAKPGSRLQRFIFRLHVSARIPLPFVPWRWAARHEWLMPLYRVSSRFWHSLDGRYAK